MYKFIFPEYGRSYKITSYTRKTCPKGRATLVAIEETGEEHIIPEHFLFDGRLVIVEE